MTQGEILAAGEAAACVIATWPGRPANRAELVRTIVESVRLFSDDPSDEDLDAVARTTTVFLKAIADRAGGLCLAIMQPAGGVH